MIRGALWLYGLWRALQRVQPVEGEPCFWCGRTNSTPPPIVGGDITVAVPPGMNPGQVAAEISRQFRERRGEGT